MQPADTKKAGSKTGSDSAAGLARGEKSPREILNDPSLTPEAKEELLRSMAVHVRSRLDALQRGGASHHEEHAHAHSLLMEIGHALRYLAPPDPKYPH